MAREWKEAIEKGEHESRADLAREKGISRVRVTQILNLLKLAPEVQEMVVRLGDSLDSYGVTERKLRAIVDLPAEEQRRRVEEIFQGS